MCLVLLFGILVGMVDDRALRLRSMLSRIGQRPDPRGDREVKRMELQTPADERNPVSNFLSRMFGERTPVPRQVETSEKNVFGKPMSVPVDSMAWSFARRPMTSPGQSPADERAYRGYAYMSDPIRYPKLERNEWGQVVRVPGEFLDEMSPLANPPRPPKVRFVWPDEGDFRYAPREGHTPSSSY